MTEARRGLGRAGAGWCVGGARAAGVGVGPARLHERRPEDADAHLKAVERNVLDLRRTGVGKREVSQARMWSSVRCCGAATRANANGMTSAARLAQAGHAAALGRRNQHTGCGHDDDHRGLLPIGAERKIAKHEAQGPNAGLGTRTDLPWRKRAPGGRAPHREQRGGDEEDILHVQLRARVGAGEELARNCGAELRGENRNGAGGGIFAARMRRRGRAAPKAAGGDEEKRMAAAAGAPCRTP